MFISLESESSKTEMEGCSKMIPTSILNERNELARRGWDIQLSSLSSEKRSALKLKHSLISSYRVVLVDDTFAKLCDS